MNAVSRRKFLTSSVLASGLTVVPRRLLYAQGQSVATSYAANQRLNIAGIGVGGRGGAHVGPSLQQNLVAVCDVVDSTVDHCLRRIEKQRTEQHVSQPLPKPFADYRQVLDQMRGTIDAVFVATADHTHAPAALRAM